MNEIQTKVCTNITTLGATLNATIVEKDVTYYAHAFIYKKATSGDVTPYNLDGLVGLTIGDLSIGNYSFTTDKFDDDTDYRVAFVATPDGVNYIVGTTVGLRTNKASFLFEGQVKVENVLWEGKIAVCGSGKTFGTFYEAALYIKNKEITDPMVYLVYNSETSANGMGLSGESYIRGVGEDITIDVTGSGQFINNGNKTYIDNIIFTNPNVGVACVLIGHGTDVIDKYNKVKISCPNLGPDNYAAGLTDERYEGTLEVHLNYVTIDVPYPSTQVLVHIADLYIDKMAYPETGLIVKDNYGTLITPEDMEYCDAAVIGTSGYGYEYGTAGALIELVEAPTAEKKVMILK